MWKKISSFTISDKALKYICLFLSVLNGTIIFVFPIQYVKWLKNENESIMEAITHKLYMRGAFTMLFAIIFIVPENTIPLFATISIALLFITIHLYLKNEIH